jgi:hypothetical protein
MNPTSTVVKMVVVAVSVAALMPLSGREQQMVTDIGSRRELFVDGYLAERLVGGAELRLHQPVPQEIVMVHDAPWEGNATAYYTVFKDDDRYRMYYRGWNITVRESGVVEGHNPQIGCYAESNDGITWRKVPLRLYEYDGSKENNIVLMNGDVGGIKVGIEAPAVFKDENPDAPAEARYKAMFHFNKYTGGLMPYRSPDGFKWFPMTSQPAITDTTRNAFDSQICSFWDPTHQVYRVYWRYMAPQDGGRAIRTATSRDYVHWENRADLKYVDSPPEQLYENCIKPYYRAPHLLIGFPVRYVERGWSASMRELPDRENREWRAKSSERYGTAITEGLVMASRDGVNFKRWNEAFVPPGPERPGAWNYGHQYIGWHVVETKSALEGAPNELSLYASEGYWLGKSSRARRYTLRLDGFVSAWAPMKGGEVISRPVQFTGGRLSLNFATSAAGSIQVEIQDAQGIPLKGFALADCAPIFGDAVERSVSWTGDKSLKGLAGQPVRLRFVLKDADLYSFRFSD